MLAFLPVQLCHFTASVTAVLGIFPLDTTLELRICGGWTLLKKIIWGRQEALQYVKEQTGTIDVFGAMFSNCCLLGATSICLLFFLPPKLCAKYHLIYLERMKQSLFKEKSNAIEVILTSRDKTPKGFGIIAENIRIGKALNTAFRTSGSCSAWVGIGLIQENPGSIKTEVWSFVILLLLSAGCLYKGSNEKSCWCSC